MYAVQVILLVTFTYAFTPDDWKRYASTIDLVQGAG